MTTNDDDMFAFEPQKVLDELTKNYTQEKPRRRPSELPVDVIHVRPELFQPRKIKGARGKLEAILLYMNGDIPIVIDGHPS